MKKSLITFFLLISLIFGISAQVVNDSQILKENHWIYDYFEIISLEDKFTSLDTKPISVGELKVYLKQIDFDKLSENGKNLYNKIHDFLYTTSYIGKQKLLNNGIEKDSSSRIALGLKINPELYFSSNKEINFNDAYYYKDWPITLPIIFGISDYVTLELDAFLGKHYYSSQSTDSITNIPLKANEMEYEFPKNAYGSFGKHFDDWGFSITVGKEGFSIGETQLGSIIYNSTFETDAYSVFSSYSPNFKYNLIFSQVEYNKFLYLHNFNIKLFPNLRIGLTEGGLRHGPIELRFFNPTIILHNQFPADQYKRDNPTLKSLDLANEYCAYLGVTVDYNPIKNLRLYFLWAQNEMQGKSELASGLYGMILPNSYGMQGGIEYVLPLKKEGYFTANIESLYTSPYLYLKQSPDWSLIKFRFDKMHQNKDVASWIGSPFGPDTFAFTTKLGYTKPQQWSANIEYLFTMKGEINSDTLLKTAPKKTDPNGQKYPAYYPSVEYYLGILDEDEAIKEARRKGLSGIIQYKHDISLSGEYWFSNKMQFSTEGTYSLIFNKEHKIGNFHQGFGFKLAFTYNFL